MKRTSVVVLLLLGACGGSPGLPIGQWSITSITPPGGATINNIDTVINDPNTQMDHTWRASGVIDIREDGTYAVGSARTKDGVLERALGSITNYTATDDTWTSEGFPTSTWSRDGGVLTLGLATAVPLQHISSETLAISGQVSVDPGGSFTPFSGDAHAALLFYLPGFQPGEIRFIIDPRDDVLLQNFGANDTQVTSFDLSRTEGALGIERVTYGTAFFSVGIVVVYDDVNQNGTLDQFVSCENPGDDCVRGFSPLAVTYRTGTSQMLIDSPFGFLLEGWTHAGLGDDLRTGTTRSAAISIDPTRAPMTADITISSDAMPLVLPQIAMER